MSALIPPTPDQDSQSMLDCLRQTVTMTLEGKRRLGQYVVIWKNNMPVVVGDDAPIELLEANQQR
ncbi:hypothetical protein GO003_007765 [Methylicorpusculum oleiharenae]|uniref:hypothetical protein n=1 Tax=Methylicorpusculum oleiharenae TaxID=1338687 RepID=UPI00135AB879|nr:hypothetical protein [Methylicorpusculum oleiharenae]MCD2450279.1 hypothetical protein [Methylicorpusculum oleiharenae]